MNSIETLRIAFARGFIGLIWLAALLVSAAAYLLDAGSPALATGFAIALAVGSTIAWLQSPTGLVTRLVTSSAISALTALLVYDFAGHPYIMDAHMVFFAGLAICAGWFDWRALFANAIVTALHHLGADLIVPALVFDAGADLRRVAFHAAVVVVQVSALTWITTKLKQAFDAAEHAARDAHSARIAVDETVLERRLLRTKRRSDAGRWTRRLANSGTKSIGSSLACASASRPFSIRRLRLRK